MIFSLLFIVVMSLISLALGLIFGSLSTWIAVTSFILSLGAVWWLRAGESEKSGKWSFCSKAIAAFILFVGFFQFAFMLYEKNMSDVQIMTLNPNNRGDLPFHINMIKAFAQGLSLWPQNMIFSGEILKYPFGTNWFNAQFEVIGIPFKAHFFAVGFLCLILSLWALHRWMGAWGLLAFFFSGGFASLQDLTSGIAWQPESSIAWKNLFLAVFVTQRGMLLALPIGAYLAGEFMPRYLKGQNESWSLKKKISLTLLWGGLAFFHLHSFFILSIVFAALVLWRKDWKNGFAVGLGAFILSLPFLVVAILPSESWQSSARWTAGWMVTTEGQSLLLWLRNFATWLAILLMTLWIPVKHAGLRWFAIGALGLFAVFNFLILAPWAWDQIKIMLWCYLIINATFYYGLFRQFKLVQKIFCAVMIFYPGFFHLYSSLPFRMTTAPVVLFKKTELENLAPQVAQVHPNERIFIAPRFDHPLFYFGRSVVMGYPGHLWAHGYNAQKLQAELQQILAEQRGLQEFRRLGAEWVLSSRYEQEEFGLSWLRQENSNDAWLLVKVPPL